MRRTFRGVGVAPGVAIGNVYLLHAEQLPVVPDPVPPERVEQEIEWFAQAREQARRELRAQYDRVLAALGDHYAGIFGVQLMILDDAGLIEETVKRIRVGRVSARWALKEVVSEYERKFAAMEDGDLRERRTDLSDVHLRLQRLLRGERAQQRRMPEGPLIVVAHTLGPSDAVELARKGVIGLVSDVGGRTSHTAILAQALSVPAVAGLHDMSQCARSGDPIIVDGDRGEVLLFPTPEDTTAATRRRAERLSAEEQAAARAAKVSARTRDGVEIAVRANIEFPDDVATAKRFGAEGVGLYRSEFLFLTCSPNLPTEQEHYETYRAIARAAAPHQAVIRTLDLGGEKYFHEVLARDEGNPVLGLRAVRFCLKRPDIFRPQLRGILRAAREPNLRVMLPLVTTVEEIREVRRLLQQEAEQLRAAGHAVRVDVPLGIMIEVPAAALAADLLAREVDFLSLGTNDLIQYALAVDRGNESVNYLYQPTHAGVLRMLRHVVDGAARHGRPLSVCGEMAADVDLLGLLIGLGVRELSVQPRAVSTVREAVAELDSRLARTEVERVLEGEPSTESPSGAGGMGRLRSNR